MSLESIILRIPAIFFAITIHEFAHGWVALRCGDPTARDAGRLTLNPLAHLDIFGAIMMIFGPFGWAKPVPVDSRYFGHYRRDIILVSVAGPVSNICAAVVFGLILRAAFELQVPYLSNIYAISFLSLCFMLNLGLSFFNLIPVPPLDGSNIVLGLLPPAKVPTYFKYIQHVPKILLGMLLVEWVFKIPVFSRVFDPVFTPYFDFWQWVVFGHRMIAL